MIPHSYLEFERPIAELTVKIEELSSMGRAADVNIAEEVQKLSQKRDKLLHSIYEKVSPWQVCQLSRHPERPYFFDYVEHLFDDFQELHGDRAFADDQAIVGGLARFHDRSVMLVGQQKGRSTKEKLKRNFGMARPEGYRKALRLFKLAERFDIPVLTFIDTAGAWPGIDAEERGQSEAIATNLLELSRLRVPIICTVIGEGGSGGALAIGVGDRLLMQQYTSYSVISPEGCAAILWRDRAFAEQAAGTLKLTAKDLLELKLIDEIIPEPLGGAHRHPKEAAAILDKHLQDHLNRLMLLPEAELLAQRQQNLRQLGMFQS